MMSKIEQLQKEIVQTLAGITQKGLDAEDKCYMFAHDSIHVKVSGYDDGMVVVVINAGNSRYQLYYGSLDEMREQLEATLVLEKTLRDLLQAAISYKSDEIAQLVDILVK